MVATLVVLAMLVLIVGAAYYVTKDKPIPVTDTPLEVIEDDLAEIAGTVIEAPADSAVAFAAEELTPTAEAEPAPEPVLELTEQVKPKRTRKPRATKAKETKAPAKRKPRAKKPKQ